MVEVVKSDMPPRTIAGLPDTGRVRQEILRKQAGEATQPVEMAGTLSL